MPVGVTNRRKICWLWVAWFGRHLYTVAGIPESGQAGTSSLEKSKRSSRPMWTPIGFTIAVTSAKPRKTSYFPLEPGLSLSTTRKMTGPSITGFAAVVFMASCPAMDWFTPLLTTVPAIRKPSYMGSMPWLRPPPESCPRNQLWKPGLPKALPTAKQRTPTPRPTKVIGPLIGGLLHGKPSPRQRSTRIWRPPGKHS